MSLTKKTKNAADKAKGAAKDVVNVMRHKAGDPKDDDRTDW